MSKILHALQVRTSDLNLSGDKGTFYTALEDRDLLIIDDDGKISVDAHGYPKMHSERRLYKKPVVRNSKATQKKIIDVLKSSVKPMNVSGMADALGVSQATIKRCLYLFIYDDVVVMIKDKNEHGRLINTYKLKENKK